MQKVGDTGDISLLFFLASANFWAISAILGHFWAILGNIGSFLGYFGSFSGHFLVLIFLAKKISLLFLLLFASLCQDILFNINQLTSEMEKVIAEIDFWPKKISTKKWPKNDPKMTQNSPKMTQNCP